MIRVINIKNFGDDMMPRVYKTMVGKNNSKTLKKFLISLEPYIKLPDDGKESPVDFYALKPLAD